MWWLVSYKEVTFIIKPPPHSWVKNLMDIENMNIKILDCKPVDRDSVVEVFEIKCNSKNLDKVIEHLEASEYIDDFEILNIDRKNGILMGVVKTSHCTVCRLFSSVSECFLGSAVYEIANRSVRWKLISNMRLVADIVDRLRDEGVDIYIDSVTPIKTESDSPELTYKQEEILFMAWKMGLFDFPRRISLNKFAEMLNLSPATVSESLRVALKKILNSYFKYYQGVEPSRHRR